jgi:hypothetical protein
MLTTLSGSYAHVETGHEDQPCSSCLGTTVVLAPWDRTWSFGPVWIDIVPFLNPAHLWWMFHLGKPWRPTRNRVPEYEALLMSYIHNLVMLQLTASYGLQFYVKLTAELHLLIACKWHISAVREGFRLGNNTKNISTALTHLTCS